MEVKGDHVVHFTPKAQRQTCPAHLRSLDELMLGPSLRGDIKYALQDCMRPSPLSLKAPFAD